MKNCAQTSNLKLKNANKTLKNEHFFLMSQESFNPKIRYLAQKVCPVTRAQTDGWTHRLPTEGTISGFQDFFLQPIIKDRPNCTAYLLSQVAQTFVTSFMMLQDVHKMTLKSAKMNMSKNEASLYSELVKRVCNLM